MIYDEDLDDEIRKAQQRLWYLRNRKRTGYPGGRKTNKPHVRCKKKQQTKDDELFYEQQIKGYLFVNRYNEYKEAMIQTSKRFVAFHNKVYKLVHKYGTEQEIEAFNKIAGNVDDTKE